MCACIFSPWRHGVCTITCMLGDVNAFYHFDRILNADESGWKLLPKGLLTWSETGVDNMSWQGNVNGKNQITVLATKQSLQN